MMFWSARGRPLESVLAFLTVLGAWIAFKLTSGGRAGMRDSGPQS
jgi:hypothetical protein